MNVSTERIHQKEGITRNNSPTRSSDVIKTKQMTFDTNIQASYERIKANQAVIKVTRTPKMSMSIQDEYDLKKIEGQSD